MASSAPCYGPGHGSRKSYTVSATMVNNGETTWTRAQRKGCSGLTFGHDLSFTQDSSASTALQPGRLSSI